MALIYDRIQQLCTEKGISGGKMCNDLGISRSTMTELKMGRITTLKLEKAIMIAEYFGVSAETLLQEGDTKTLDKSPEDINFDDFTYALAGEARELSIENKEKLLEMAKFFKQQQTKAKNNQEKQ